MKSVVTAAMHGHILITEGLQKAERNVLPVINNLLENREGVRELRNFDEGSVVLVQC